MDRHEAALEELDEGGQVVRFHPHYRGVEGRRVRAVSRRGLLPQSHVSRDEAARACREAGKRLCSGVAAPAASPEAATSTCRWCWG